MRLSVSLYLPSRAHIEPARQNARAREDGKGMRRERERELPGRGSRVERGKSISSTVFFRPSFWSISFAPVGRRVWPASRHSSTKRDEQGRREEKKIEEGAREGKRRDRGLGVREVEGSKTRRRWLGRGLKEARNSRVPKYSRVGKGRWTEGERGGRQARFRSSSKAGKDLPLLPSRSLALATPAEMHPRNCRLQ